MALANASELAGARSGAVGARQGAAAGGFEPQELANTLWALATVGQRCVALAQLAEWSMGDFQAQELANMAWSFATSALSGHAPLFMTLSRAAEQRVGDSKV